MPVVKRCDPCTALKGYTRVTLECGHILLWHHDRPFLIEGQTVVCEPCINGEQRIETIDAVGPDTFRVRFAPCGHVREFHYRDGLNLQNVEELLPTAM